ncbi:MAG: RdgB/HAM1 family non-canonical purine NTP pyrophosphatase [Spirosomataceae bacterium]
MKPLCFATNNAHKLYEVQALLGNQFVLKTLKDIGCTEDIAETETTIEGNSLLKAKYIWDNYHVDCFADDSGLEVMALNGVPGVYSARYAGIHHDPAANNQLLLYNMEGITNRQAQFRSVITLILGGNVTQFEGIVTGCIIEQLRGTEGFGYDPLFIPDGFEQTFAEMPLEQKNQISHRGKAVGLLVAYLKQQKG